MSIKVTYKDGVCEPLERLEGATPGTIYTLPTSSVHVSRPTIWRRGTTV